MDEKELEDATFFDKVNNGKFDIRLDFDFDEWMKDKDDYQAQFQDEVAAILDIKPDEIEIDKYQKGSTRFQMSIGKIWRWYKITFTNIDPTPIHEEFVRSIRVQDQIAVEWDGEFLNATISTVFDDDGNGKYFQVRYNPRDNAKGKDPFLWNTEWFYSKNEGTRLLFPGQEHCIRDIVQGEGAPFRWEPPAIANRQRKVDIRVNDHIFVKLDKCGWRRCKVFRRTEVDEGVHIRVKELKDGKTIGLRLWENADRNKIAFVDMRG